MNRKRKLILWVFIVVIVSGVIAFIYINDKKNNQSVDDNPIKIDDSIDENIDKNIDKDKILEKVGTVIKENDLYFFITESEKYLIINSHVISEEILTNAEDINNNKKFRIMFKNQGEGNILYVNSAPEIEENVDFNIDYGEIDLSESENDGIISKNNFFDETSLDEESVEAVLKLLGGQVKRTRFQKHEMDNGDKYYIISMYSKTVDDDMEADTIFDLVYNINANSVPNESYISNVSMDSITNYDKYTMEMFLKIYKNENQKLFLTTNLCKAYENYLKSYIEQHIENNTEDGNSLVIDIGSFGDTVYLSILNSKNEE
ncbi:MAG: hypothetical protein ACERKV_08565 [Clostridiaceae bacterium]